MEEINEKEFKRRLASTEISEHNDLLINFQNVTNVNLNKIALSNKFKNCKFTGKRLDFMDLSIGETSDLTHTFRFDDCEFENDVFFKDCVVQEIQFVNISKPVKKLHLAPNKLGLSSFTTL